MSSGYAVLLPHQMKVYLSITNVTQDLTNFNHITCNLPNYTIPVQFQMPGNTRSSPIAERPHDASCHWISC